MNAAHPLLPDLATLTLDSIRMDGGVILFAVRTTSARAACPLCAGAADRIHSRYQRTLLDLPWQGNTVRLELTCRKFFCDNPDCTRRVFAEPLSSVATRYSRKTCRLVDALHELTYLAGGEAAARIARAFGLPLSPDALLYQLKHATASVSLTPSLTPRVLGMDDFAFRRGRHYGTILVDLERRRPVDLLPDREPETVAAWLRQHPGVQIISRDRGSAYIEGATKGAPQAVQVADRWHLLKNLGDALERLLTRHHKTLREVVQSAQEPAPLVALPDPRPAPPSPRHLADKDARRERRLTRFEQIKRLLNDGHSQREVARRTGHSRRTIHQLAACAALPESAARQKRRSKITPFAEHLRQRWWDGCYNATRLHGEITAMGFTGNVSVVQRFVQSWREKPGSRVNGRHPPPLSLTPRQCGWLLTNPEHPRLTHEQRDCLRRLTQQCPVIAAAQNLALAFCRLVRERRGADEFAAWLEQAAQSDVTDLKTFARGLVQDQAAVEAALSLSWSNGQVEGQVNRLKFLKRQMYGQASFDLLRARVLPLSKAA
jgi:transposase